jgi:hypothetical protein
MTADPIKTIRPNYADLSTVRPFTIGGKTYNGDDIMRAVNFGGNLQQDEAEVSSWIAFWGARIAEAKEDYDIIEMEYRIARDSYQTRLLVDGVEDGDGKQVKVNKTNAEVMWRAHDDYPSWWKKQHAAERAWNTASYVYEACCRKTTMLTAMTKARADEVSAYFNSNRSTN